MCMPKCACTTVKSKHSLCGCCLQLGASLRPQLKTSTMLPNTSALKAFTHEAREGIASTLSALRLYSRRKVLALHTFIISLAILISYWPVLTCTNGEFVHDDISAVLQNHDSLGTNSLMQVFSNDFWGEPMKHMTSHKSYRPVTILSFR